MELDHVLWACADLDEAVDALRESTGFEAVPGGSHPGWGTRNALVGLGDTYLEVLATDPAQEGGWLADEVSSLPGPTMHRWALRTTDMDGVVARVEVAGLRMEPTPMARRRPDGTDLRWSIAFVEGHDLGPVVPFVIDWLDSVPPSRVLPVQGRLVDVQVVHPDPVGVDTVLEALGVVTDVVSGPVPGLRARLETRSGPVVLG